MTSAPDMVEHLSETHRYGWLYQGELRLRCPQCKQDLTSAENCRRCGFVLQEHDGIVRALSPERAAHFECFIQDYERIRASEGRGSQDKSYYLCLPYVDMTGNNGKQWKIRARSYDHLRSRILPQCGQGSLVLDLGAGNCWLSYRLAEQGYRPVAADLILNDQDGLGAAIHFQRELGSSIPRFQAEMENLPFQDNQFDCIIYNASFHYAEDAEAVLRESLRCLKPTGTIVISDTAWYSREASGAQMIAERKAFFQQKFKTASDSIDSVEFLTDARLDSLAKKLSLQWTVHRPWYGWAWAMRPWIARLRGRREPSRFRLYVGKAHR